MATQFIPTKVVQLPPAIPQRPEVIRARPRRRRHSNSSAITIAAVQYDGRLS